VIVVLELQHPSYFRLFFVQLCEFFESVDDRSDRRRRRCWSGRGRESIDEQRFVSRVIDDRESQQESKESCYRSLMHLIITRPNDDGKK
jgi:hypothetical protein